jgi:hypothetical protein
VKETLDDVFEEDSDVLQLPALFLLNKNDKSEFRGVDFITDRLGLSLINCQESVILPVSAIDLNGLEAAINWIMSAVAESNNKR